MAITPSLAFTDLRGLNSADPATRLPDGVATDMANVLCEPLSLGRRRPSLAAVSLTSGPTGSIRQIYRYQRTIKGGDIHLAALSGTAMHLLLAGTWSTITVSDTVTVYSTARPYMATHNGKLFIAYDSDVNRLHIYDPAVSTSALRRVGIAASAAATVANTGAGAYAATLRYYKIQWKIVSGSDTVATSELSASVSFTPSGSGTAARVTKPTTPDSATHWIVFGSSDNLNYYDISGNIAVGTTTYDDSATPSGYNAGTIAPTAGLYVPPPAAKYLLSVGNRLLMAGCHETSGSSDQTAPRNSRVWFTQVLGALDNTGEDEAIAQTVDTKDWIDVGENDGDTITGLGGPIDGVVYVFKERTIWLLSPTGVAETPYRADRLAQVGATWQDSVTLGEDGQGRPALYFMSATGPKRIVSGQIEDIGADLRDTTSSTFSSLPAQPLAIWDEVRRVVWWITTATSGNSSYAFQPQFEARTSHEGVRGGWTRHTGFQGGQATYAVALFGDPLVPYLAGASNGFDQSQLMALSGSSRRDIDTTAIAASVTSAIYQPAGALRRFTCEHPILEWDYPGAATAPSVSLSSVIGGPTNSTGSAITDTVTSATYTAAVVQEKLEAIALADISGAQLTVTWDTSVDGTERPRINSVEVPVRAQERS